MDQKQITANHRSVATLTIGKTLEKRYRFRQRQVIEKLYLNDALSAREVAAALGCGHSSVNRIVKEMGLKGKQPVRRPKYARASPNKSQRQLAFELRRQKELRTLVADGLSFSKIARLFNEKGYPTPSGNGTWRAPAIRRIALSTSTDVR